MAFMHAARPSIAELQSKPAAAAAAAPLTVARRFADGCVQFSANETPALRRCAELRR